MSSISTHTPRLAHPANTNKFDHPPAPYSQKQLHPSWSDNILKQLTRDNLRIIDNNRDGQITISYNFFEPSVANSGRGGFSEARKRAFRNSMRAWEDVANVKFIENGKSADTHLLLHSNPGSGGYATLPSRGGGHPMDIGIGVGDKDAALNASMIHELGHSLGLLHPTGREPDNNKTHTAMSYNTHFWRPFNKNGRAVSDSVSTPMMHDIIAIQKLYGVNRNTRTGDTTYGFNSNSEREYYSLKSASDLVAFCIWDGGGNDTLDFSGFKQDQEINLNAGTLSNIGGRRGNVSIAKDVVVENAIGGSGNDVLIGNQANNRLTGGGGGDILSGGGGANTFVYNSASESSAQGPDRLNDFVTGVDKLDLSGVLKEVGITKPVITSILTDRRAVMNGTKGELVFDYDEKIKMHRLILDVSGNGKSFLFILSKNPLNPRDILGISDAGQTTLPRPSKPDIPPQDRIQPLPQAQPRVQPLPKAQPRVQPLPKAQPQVQPLPKAQPRIQPLPKAQPRVQPLPKAQPRVQPLPKAQPRVQPLPQAQPRPTTQAKPSPEPSQIRNLKPVLGTSCDDRLSGNAGDNILTGGGGADVLEGNGGFNVFNYRGFCDSTRNEPDLLVDFNTGKDKIDLSQVAKETRLTFKHVKQFTGRAGDTIVQHNPTTGRHFLGVDMTGNRKTDFLIKSTRPISSEDVIGLTIEDDGYF